MENQQSTAPQNFESPTTKSSRTRIVRIIGICIAIPLALFVGLIIFFAITGGGDAPNSTAAYYKKALKAKPGDTNGPFYERAGFARAAIGKTIADAQGADISKRDTVAKLTDGTAIIQACTVLSPADLQKNNLTPTTEAQTSRVSMSQSYIDNNGLGPIATDDLYNTEDLNECYYPLKTLTETVTVHVVQDFQAKGTLLPDMLHDNFTPVPAFNGLNAIELFKEKTNGKPEAGYVIHSGQTYVRLTVHLLDKSQLQTTTDELAKTIGTNLLRVSQNPEGQLVATYKNSPTYNTTYLRACTVLGEDSIKTLGFTHASPYATETIATATGVATFTSLHDDKPYVYVQNKCERDGVQADKSVGGHVTLTTTTYKDEAGAMQDMASTQKAAKDAVNISNLGDSALVTKDDKGGDHFIIRKNRLLIDIVYAPKTQQISDVSTYKTTIEPLAQQVLENTPQL